VARIVWMPEAADELEHAWQWYASQNPVAAERFADEVVRVLDVITEAPGRWALAGHGTRRVPLHRFPFKVVYRWDPGDEVVRLVAIAHTKRRDGYWRDR
jgi:plasmid stabilization system protein ParE